MKFDSAKFLNNPPGWIQFFFWVYPATWFYSLLPLALLLGPFDVGDKTVLAMNWFFIPPIFMFVASGWFRKNIFFMAAVWIVMGMLSGITQGALSSAISKAFSAVHNTAHGPGPGR